METFGKIIAYIIIAVLGTIYGGFVFSKLWIWFVVPIFALPILTLTQAIGLTMVTRLAAMSSLPKDDKDKGLLESALVAVLFYTIILFIGWVVQLFL